MVAKMKKFTFLVFYKDYEAFLNDLRDLGLIHVATNDKVVSDDEASLSFVAKLKQLQETKKVLIKARDKKNDQTLHTADIERGFQLINEVDSIQQKKASLQQQLQVASKERDAIAPWGDFDPQMLKKIADSGYKIHFCVVPNAQYNPEWESKLDAIVIKQEASKTYFVAVTKSETLVDELGIEEVKIPEVSLSKLNALIDSLKDEMRQLEQQMTQLSADIPSIDAAIKQVESEITFARVKGSGNKFADDKLMLLQGWAPEDNMNEISQYLESKNAYFEISDPAPEDDVPIKFKNNKFTKLFEPIAEMYMLPKYNEIDLTPYFAPFYMIFFGLSLGDIGYGFFLFLVSTIAAIFMRKTLSADLRGMLTLVQILGASAFFCGLLTGGFFGFQIYDIQLPIFQKLKSIVFLDNNQMFILSLLLGVVQILFGMVLKVFNRIRQFGFVYGLSTIGWFILLVSMIISALLPKIMPMFGTLHLTIIGISAIFILFFNSPGKNLFMNLGLALWDTYNMITGLLGDVLSYVRLFALGLSGSILASVFNSLAAGMSPDNVILGPIVAALIFIVGHAITIFMNTLGAFVHPMRLTFVEFYKNAEFSGGGKKYNPFRKLS